MKKRDVGKQTRELWFPRARAGAVFLGIGFAGRVQIAQLFACPWQIIERFAHGIWFPNHRKGRVDVNRRRKYVLYILPTDVYTN
jgi:hypothetical protein